MRMLALAMRDFDFVGVEVDRFDIADKKLRSLQKLADRIQDVGRVEVAGGYFMQHWSKEKEIVAVHQRYLDIRIRTELFFQFSGGVETAEAAAEDHNLFSAPGHLESFRTFSNRLLPRVGKAAAKE